MSAQSFLAEHWQKQTLFIVNGLSEVVPALSPDEIAWLATLPDVEARLVFGERHGQRTNYRVQHGPFEEAELAALPATNWTLLVQDVEKHLPDFREQLAWIKFVPDWRIDDVMVSVAAPGGSVGPHKDNYDVFLCQGQGSRNWRVATHAETEVDTDAEGLALLKPFDGDVAKHAVTGDVLYLPPGIPHWGIATDLCVTYSLGMRAPNVAELLAGVERLYPDTSIQAWREQDTAAQVFYTDPDLCVTEATAGLVSIAAVDRLRQLGSWTNMLDDRQLASVLGSVVTDPKAWLSPEGMSRKEAAIWIAKDSRDGVRLVNGMARIAFYSADDYHLFFANGYCTEVSHSTMAQARGLCKHRFLARDAIAEAALNTELESFILWLATHGVFDTSENFLSD